MSKKQLMFASLLIFAVTRLLMFSDTFRSLGDYDTYKYLEWIELLGNGVSPSESSFTYPPGASLIFVVIGAVPLDFLRTFSLVALAVDTVIFLLLTRAARSSLTGYRGPLVWAIGGFAVGSLLYQRFDLWVALLVVVAMLARKRSVLFGVLLGIGFITKIWPAVLLVAQTPSRWFRSGLALVLSSVLGWFVLDSFFSDSTVALRNQAAQGLQIETLTTWPFLVSNIWAGGLQIRETGQTEVLVPIAAQLQTLHVVLMVSFLTVIVIAQWLGKLRAAQPTDVAVLVLTGVVVLNDGFTPQYSIWVLAVAAVALLYPQSRVLWPTMLVVLGSFVFQFGIQDHYAGLVLGDHVTVALQGLRLSLWVGAFLMLIRCVLFDSWRTSSSFAGGNKPSVG